MKHTEGNIEVRPYKDAFGCYQVMQFTVTQREGTAGEPKITAIEHANAKRLQDCWNACEKTGIADPEKTVPGLLGACQSVLRTIDDMLDDDELMISSEVGDSLVTLSNELNDAITEAKEGNYAEEAKTNHDSL